MDLRPVDAGCLHRIYNTYVKVFGESGPYFEGLMASSLTSGHMDNFPKDVGPEVVRKGRIFIEIRHLAWNDWVNDETLVAVLRAMNETLKP